MILISPLAELAALSLVTRLRKGDRGKLDFFADLTCGLQGFSKHEALALLLTLLDGPKIAEKCDL